MTGLMELLHNPPQTYTLVISDLFFIEYFANVIAVQNKMQISISVALSPDSMLKTITVSKFYIDS